MCLFTYANNFYITCCFHFNIYYCPRNESWVKVMFLQAFVILFTGGLSTLPPPSADNPTAADTPQSRHPPPPQSILGDTVNAWAVCILLQWNVVIYFFTY